ncbi:hypothetical protein EJ05DRAFT_480268 [Pseudovirgaria hyperparasitica]|uniref:chitinase n=1 Tax=Pseudovirgaria hyperparasitica TaxID=470096 RepID=A0A6A6VVZ6_9PEZI|nr:uncharacterized protein EJ05DRAFT_480268 [Pseudovirgaria hyperparasitica]KAF2753810.1 hypothetical protein EJ05DRAFT_480268 [Pseudovirgaria hyperparasitica]
MRYTSPAARYLASVALLVAPSLAQTYSNCNPISRSDCPADSALGKTVNIDFKSASDSFTPQGNPTYGSDGVSFTVAKSGDSPQLTSKWYIMFGKVEVSIKAAPGAGMVSSFVLQSDTLDEIDWEWLGADAGQVQTNYFGKGQTTTFNRGAFHADPDNQARFKTYTIDWTPNQIVWQIDGVTVRALSPNDANGQYPQTPMQIKVGAWAGGDPSNNAPGTVEWARGPIDYSQGPYTMQVGSMKVTDYSTGTQYRYKDSTGTWQSIEAVGGTINSGGSSEVEENPPTVTSTSSGQPVPFDGTHSDDSSTYIRPSVYPWVPEATTLSTASPTYANYPGLPSGWTVSDSGKVVPPSSAPVSKRLAWFLPYLSILTFVLVHASSGRVYTVFLVSALAVSSRWC